MDETQGFHITNTNHESHFLMVQKLALISKNALLAFCIELTIMTERAILFDASSSVFTHFL